MIRALPTLSAIPVFYHQLMIADDMSTSSPSAYKAREVVASWQARGFPISLEGFSPAAIETLALAHDEDYVRGILVGTLSNGFRNHSLEVAESLPYTSGAMLAATLRALENRAVACAPVSGFHHASYSRSSGYCTFNGLMVATQYVLRNRLAQRVGIFDADMHEGDGTDSIIDEYNLHHRVRHVTLGKDYRYPLQAEGFIRNLPAMIESFGDCEVLLYQAGADPHINDPLGGWLTTGQLAERDRIVFETCRSMKLPIAWNLAGGYQRDANHGIRPVLDIHDNTMRACVGVWVSS